MGTCDTTTFTSGTARVDPQTPCEEAAAATCSAGACKELADFREENDRGPVLDPCESGPGQTPVTEPEYQCSIGVNLQPHVDLARRQAHVLGLRPYRVYLVWEQRDRPDREWREIRRKELMPVRVLTLDSIDLELAEVGLNSSGAIQLREVSPLQVTEAELYGYLDGKPLNQSYDPEQRFYYEVVKQSRCPGDMTESSGELAKVQFVLGARPFHNGGSFDFRVTLLDINTQDTTRGSVPPPDTSGKVTRLRR